MTITLELPEELESELSAKAARQGLSLTEYALRILSTDRANPIRLQTGAELVAYWQKEGLIGTRPDIDDSQVHARKIRREAEQRTGS